MESSTQQDGAQTEVTVPAMQIYTVDQVKDKIKAKENVTGLVFVNARGAHGKILPDLSIHGKRQAEMTCTVPEAEKECTETHVREQSDWHQSYACRTHKKSKTKGGTSPTTMGSIKLPDGTLVSFQRVLETDAPEMRTLKEQNNELYESVRTQKAQQLKDEKEKKVADRKAKLEEDRQKRALDQEEEKRRQLVENFERIIAYSRKNNLKVSPDTLKKVEEYRAEQLAKAASKSPTN